MKTCIRESDTIARFGGDEFAILLPVITHADDAAKIAEKILSIFKTAYVVDGQELHITPSSAYDQCGHSSPPGFAGASFYISRIK